MLQTIGKALTVEQQRFVSANLFNFHAFLATEQGQELIRLVVEEWEKSLTNPGNVG